jgi:signal transduction histidine kinase
MSVTAAAVNDIDAERLRIARELHDVISYGFATISLQAGAAVQVLDQKPQQAAEALQAIKVASRDALEELRGILGLLRQPDGSSPVHTGLERLGSLAETTSKAGVPTSVDVSGCHGALPVSVSRAAYRIAQEALANVLRHAGDASANVSVVREEDRLLITVEDDGTGLEPDAEPVTTGSGFGIMGMRERALALGGELQAGPRPEGGFRVTALLPISEAS